MGRPRRSAKRMKLSLPETEEPQGMDWITNLPDDILDVILSLLPIKALAKTAVLSKYWRSLWYSCPVLDFTTINVNPVKKGDDSEDESYSLGDEGLSLISKVLAHRNKHCSYLNTLRFNARLSFSELNSLIRCAVRYNVQNLDVQFATDGYFNLPRSLLASTSLRTLRLSSRRGRLRLPPPSIMRSSLQFLGELSLSGVNLKDHPSPFDLFKDPLFPQLKKLNLGACFGFSDLHVSCKALQDLSVEYCSELNELKICCRNLVRLRVAGCFSGFRRRSSVKIISPKLRVLVWENNDLTEESSLEKLNSLHEVSVGFAFDFLFKIDDISDRQFKSICNLLSGVSNANSLTLNWRCMEILSSRNRPEAPTIILRPFSNLKFLNLEFSSEGDNFLGLALLFRHSPILQTLILRMSRYRIYIREEQLQNIYSYWESQIESLESFLQHLKVVRIERFYQNSDDMSLAKFLLAHGNALKKINLVLSYTDRLAQNHIISAMGSFLWASNAKLTVQVKLQEDQLPLPSLRL